MSGCLGTTAGTAVAPPFRFRNRRNVTIRFAKASYEKQYQDYWRRWCWHKTGVKPHEIDDMFKALWQVAAEELRRTGRFGFSWFRLRLHPPDARRAARRGSVVASHLKESKARIIVDVLKPLRRYCFEVIDCGDGWYWSA